MTFSPSLSASPSQSQSQSPSPDQPTRRAPLGPRELVGMMAMVMALNALAIDTMLPALPDMGQALAAPDANARQHIVTAYLLGTGAGALVYGPLADRYGRRRVLMGALLAYTLIALASAFGTSFAPFVILRFVHGLAGSALGVVVVAIIRDLFEGDAMARRMSLVFLVFMGVPVIAPAIGQGVLMVADWRWIFGVLAAMGAMMMVWVGIRLPETLRREDVVPLSVRAASAVWRTVVLNRSATGHVLAAACAQAALYGYLTSAQQIVADIYDAADRFAAVFAGVAVGIAIANWSNSRIVERFGARRVSQAALILYIALGATQLWLAQGPPMPLWQFTVMMAANVGLIGFLGSNMGSIAMQPFGHVAGAASSFQSFARMVIAAPLGGLIGQAYDGTLRPLAWGFVGCGVAAAVLVVWAERGRLFRRLHPATARTR